MNQPESTPSNPARVDAVSTTENLLSKREYFAVHLFEAVTAKLSQNCSLQDKAQYAVEAADALIVALEREA